MDNVFSLFPWAQFSLALNPGYPLPSLNTDLQPNNIQGKALGSSSRRNEVPLSLYLPLPGSGFDGSTVPRSRGSALGIPSLDKSQLHPILRLGKENCEQQTDGDGERTGKLMFL